MTILITFLISAVAVAFSNRFSFTSCLFIAILLTALYNVVIAIIDVV